MLGVAESYLVGMKWDGRKRPARLRAVVKPAFWKLGARARRRAASELAISVKAWLFEVTSTARAKSGKGA